MGLKHHTIIVVPHTRARFRKWRVTNRQLAIGVGLVMSALVVSGFTTWSFFARSVDKNQLSKLSEENRLLRDANQKFETDIRELKSQLSSFEERTRQLAIVAGLDGGASEQDTGIGGDSGVGIDAVERDLAALQTDSVRVSASLDQVDALLTERSRRILATPSITPVRGVLTSGYGYRADPITGNRTFHRGIDLSTSPGQPIYAPADGVVVLAERAGRLGNSISLSHGFGYSTRFGHLSKIVIEAGQKVTRGDVIGFVGNTGRTTGYHLHYEIKLDGKPVNPLAYILDKPTRRS
jgi:murein DD-endopeptidase MepM/ murein hydrolase activator NlpD